MELKLFPEQYFLVVSTVISGISVTAKYYPGRGCGLSTPYRYFKEEPSDKTLLKCAFVGENHLTVPIKKRTEPFDPTGNGKKNRQFRP